MIVNRGQLASILGITEPTLDRMVQRREVIGKKKGSRWEFDTKAVIAKLVKDASKNTTGSKKGNTELRIALADAEMKEFKVAELRKTMVHVDDVLPLFEEQLAIAKSLFSALPGRVNQRLAVLEDPAEILRVLKAEIAEVLDAITNAEAKQTHKPAVSKPIDPDTLEDEPDEEDTDEPDTWDDTGEERAKPGEDGPLLTDDGY
jgi:phage terminase Nu1 subunit (DNA packaging protein)